MGDLGPPPLWLPPEPAIVRPGRIERAPLPIEAVLPGLAPVLAKKPAAPTTLSFFNSATSSATTITAPTSISAGALIILVDHARNTSGTPTSVTPTGFTLITGGSITGGDNLTRTNLTYKIADGSEGGTSITGMAGTNFVRKTMFVFNGGIASVTPSTVSSSGITDGDPAAQNVASGTGTPPLVVIGSAICKNVNPTLSMSPTEDGSVSNGRVVTGYKIYNSSPANVSVDTPDNGDQNVAIGFYLQVN